MKSKAKIRDLTGQKFGRLTVIGIAETDTRKTYWVCQCDCGNFKTVRADSLISGKIKSCGCLKKEQDAINLTANHSHKMSGTRIYSEWQSMKGRCHNPNDPRYNNWGGRGIKVCDEWKEKFETFYEWAINNGYQDNLTIDRIDNDGDYTPENCRWATQQEQSRNRSTNITVTIGNVTKTLAEWCEIFELDYQVINRRYHMTKGDLSLDYLFSKGKYRGNQQTADTVERRE